MSANISIIVVRALALYGFHLLLCYLTIPDYKACRNKGDGYIIAACLIASLLVHVGAVAVILTTPV
jgi:hypothetical protein